jgi:hypothetical protein
MPWIHVDLCAIYLEAIENVAVNGAYNAALQMILQIQLLGYLGYRLWI